MNFGGHLLTGWALSQAGDFTRTEQRVITLMAIAPDVDGLAILLPGTFEEWHRTFGHNIFFGLGFPLLSLLIARHGRRVLLLTFSYLAMFSHFLLDLFVTGWWALYPLWPVSDWMILMSLYIPEPVMKYHLQITLFASLVVLAVVLYRKRGRSPFSLVSDRFDKLHDHLHHLPIPASVRALFFTCVLLRQGEGGSVMWTMRKGWAFHRRIVCVVFTPPDRVSHVGHPAWLGLPLPPNPAHPSLSPPPSRQRFRWLDPWPCR